jgi:thiol-disulfide isomerase/thioredoxin
MLPVSVLLQRCFWAFASVVSVVSCSFEREWQAKRTVISGAVKNGTETVLLVNFCDPLSDEQRFAQNLTNTNGNFHAIHDYVFAQNATVRYGNSFINFYINPGDSIFIAIDGAKLQQNRDDAVTFSGDNAQINEQLFRWTKYAYHDIPEFNPLAPPREYLDSIRQCFRAMQDTIDAYSRRNEMSDFMKRWALTDYKFVVANYLMDYEGAENKWNVFTDPIFDLYNEQNFRSMYFPYHLAVCMNALATDNDAISAQMQRKEYAAALRSLMNELSGKAPRGKVGDMMIYLSARRLISESFQLYDSVPELKSFFSQAVFDEKLKALAREKAESKPAPLPVSGETMKGVSFLDNGSIVALPDIEALPYLTERYKNKVLYIDVWATWCGPCREEMKHAPMLHEYFAGKDVVFINLCMESTFSSWLQMIGENAIGGENYYFDKNAGLLFMGQHNISGFPSYLLIDGAGRRHTPVSRPSDMQSAIRQIKSCMLR